MLRLRCVSTALCVLLFGVLGCSDGDSAVGPTVVPDDSALRALGARARAKGMNLVVITLDTVRADRLGSYGHAAAATRVMDDLAAPGLRFENASAVTPLTMPSHASIFTGLYPPEHGVRFNGTFVLDERYETLAEILGEHGYATGGFVGAFVLAERFGIGQGFQHFDDRVDPRPISAIHPPERHAGKVTDAALEWLRRQSRGRPLFLWVHYFDAHWPYHPEAPFADRFEQSPYDGELAHVDEQIGRLLDAFKSTGRMGDTIVCLTSDHGEGLNDHGESTHGTFAYEATLRVPLVLHAPTLFPDAVVVDDRVISHVDIMPTLLDLLGIDRSDQKFDGENVFEIGAGNARAVYFETLSPLLQRDWAPLFGLRRRDDKLIFGPEPEYYEVWRDPGEVVDLYGERDAAAEIESALLEKLARWESVDDVVEKEQPLDPETAARLEALGYGRTAAGHRVGERENPMRMLPLWNSAMEAMGKAQRGDLQSAREEIELAIEGDPGNGMVWTFGGHIYRLSKDLDRAALYFRKSIQLAPLSATWGMLAEVEFERGDSEEGFAAIDEGLKVDSRDGTLHLAAAIGLAGLGEYEKALAAVDDAIVVDPVNTSVRGDRIRRIITARRDRNREG